MDIVYYIHLKTTFLHSCHLNLGIFHSGSTFLQMSENITNPSGHSILKTIIAISAGSPVASLCKETSENCLKSNLGCMIIIKKCPILMLSKSLVFTKIHRSIFIMNAYFSTFKKSYLLMAYFYL